MSAVKNSTTTKSDKTINKMYEDAWQLREAFKDVKQNPKYKNMSNDELLYGEKGVWSTNNLEDDE